MICSIFCTAIILFTLKSNGNLNVWMANYTPEQVKPLINKGDAFEYDLVVETVPSCSKIKPLAMYASKICHTFSKIYKSCHVYVWISVQTEQ